MDSFRLYMGEQFTQQNYKLCLFFRCQSENMLRKLEEELH